MVDCQAGKRYCKPHFSLIAKGRKVKCRDAWFCLWELPQDWETQLLDGLGTDAPESQVVDFMKDKWAGATEHEVLPEAIEVLPEGGNPTIEDAEGKQSEAPGDGLTKGADGDADANHKIPEETNSGTDRQRQEEEDEEDEERQRFVRQMNEHTDFIDDLFVTANNEIALITDVICKGEQCVAEKRFAMPEDDEAGQRKMRRCEGLIVTDVKDLVRVLKEVRGNLSDHVDMVRKIISGEDEGEEK